MDFIRIIYVSIITMSMLFSALSSQGYAKNFESSRKSILFHEIIRKFEKQMQKDFDLIPTGSGGRVHDKIEEFEVFFCTSRNYSINEARVLEVTTCEKLLNIINNFPEAKEWLDHYPFSYTDITVFIRLNDLREELHVYQTIGDKLAAITLINGDIIYKKCHPKKMGYVNIKKEPFEESVKIVRLLDAKP